MIFILFCVILPALISLATSLFICEIEKKRISRVRRND